MNKNYQNYETANFLQPLATAFEQVLQRVAALPKNETGRILTAFAASLVNEDSFNLALIEELPDLADRLLCLTLFEYCMAEGLTEDERCAASAAFAPWTEIHAPGVRH